MWTWRVTVGRNGRAEGYSYKRSKAGAKAADKNKSCSKKKCQLPGPESRACGLRAGGLAWSRSPFMIVVGKWTARGCLEGAL